MSRSKRRLWIGLLVSALMAAVYLAAGTVLIAAAPADVGPPARGETVSFQSRSGSQIAAWEVPGACECGVVVVLHGVRANRSDVANRVALFNEVGYAVVAADLQAHGESPGEHITFGYLEQFDARGAVSHARSRFPGQPVAVVGVSLGGAASTLAGAHLGADAVVLEAVYADIESATRNRLRRRAGRLGSALAPVLLAQLPLRTGIHPADLRPVESIGSLGVPVLIVAGTEDEHTTPADTRRLYAAARAPKTLWWVEGAAHVDFLNYAPDAYREHVLGFLHEHLAAVPEPSQVPPADGDAT